MSYIIQEPVTRLGAQYAPANQQQYVVEEIIIDTNPQPAARRLASQPVVYEQPTYIEQPVVQPAQYLSQAQQLVLYEPPAVQYTAPQSQLVPYVQPANQMVVYEQPTVLTQPPPVYHGQLIPVGTPAMPKRKMETSNQQIAIIPSGEDLMMAAESPFVHPTPQLVGPAPNIYGRGVDPRRRLTQTDMGDIILISDTVNVIKHATFALAPVLEIYNTARYQQGLHPVGIERKQVTKRQQKMFVENKRHLVIFCCSGGNIRALSAPQDATDFKYIYSQYHNGLNEVMMLICGQLTFPRLYETGIMLQPNPAHQELYDPIIRDSGVFQNCKISANKLKCGEVLSFTNSLNPVQQKHIMNILNTIQRRCHVLKKQKDFWS